MPHANKGSYSCDEAQNTLYLHLHLPGKGMPLVQGFFKNCARAGQIILKHTLQLLKDLRVATESRYGRQYCSTVGQFKGYTCCRLSHAACYLPELSIARS